MAVKEYSSEAAASQRPDNLSCTIGKILAYIDEISQDVEDAPAVCRQIVHFLCHVEVPHQPDQIPAFRDKIKKVDQFLETLSASNQTGEVVTICLNELYAIMRKNKPMSSAAGIVLHRIPPNKIQETAKMLLVGSGYTSDDDLRRGVNMLISWITSSHFITNLQQWIVGILKGLCDMKKYALLMDIAEKNIDKLLNLASLPVYNPPVWTILLHMLASCQHTPVLFDRVVKLYIKQHPKQLPADAQQAEQLENTLAALLLHFPNRPYTEQLSNKLRPSTDFRHSLDVPPWQDQTSMTAVRRRQRNVRVGLINLGNTCYMNSVLQALMLSKQFTRDLLLTDVRTPLFQNMQRLLALLLHSDRSELTPSAVLQSARPPGFHPGHEQDSSEFLGHLLDQLHEQEKGKLLLQQQQSLASDALQLQKQKPQMMSTADSDQDDDLLPTLATGGLIAAHFADQPSTSSGSYASGRAVAMQPPSHGLAAKSLAAAGVTASTSAAGGACSAGGGLPPTVIQRSFGGHISITYKCLECQAESKQFDSFRDLHLSFPDPEAQTAHSVQELLDFYCTAERLDADNKYFCDQCKRLCVGQRYIDIVQAPRSLILTLKHFKYDQKYNQRAKLMHRVHHDEVLSVVVVAGGGGGGQPVGAEEAESGDGPHAQPEQPDLLLQQPLQTQTLYYRLYAAVVHSGVSMETGHYFTYGTDAAGQCYRFDDSYVCKSSTAELDRLQPPQTPYILFYQRIDDVVAQAQQQANAVMADRHREVEMHSPRKSPKLVASTSPMSSTAGAQQQLKATSAATTSESLAIGEGHLGLKSKSPASTSLVGGGGASAIATDATSLLFDYPALQDLPPQLREHVNRDNIQFGEEAQRAERTTGNSGGSSSVMARNRRNDMYRPDDDDDDDSNGGGGPHGTCGPNFAPSYNRYIS